VVVSSSATTKINTVNAEVTAELNLKQLQELPVEGRDITRSLYRLPGVVQATGFFAEAPNVSINGANSLYTSYLIDGMDNNEQFLGGQRFAIPLGFTQNVTVLTNNFSAEYGLSANGIIDITTRSGSNQFSGEAFYLTRPGPVIDGKSEFAQRDLSGNFVKDGFMRQQGGFAFGGAIKKDKTFYYINAEQTIDFKDNLLNVPQLNINETVPGKNRFTYISGKLDQKWSSRFSSSLRVNLGLVNIERQGGGLDGGTTFPSAGNSEDRNSFNIALKNIYVTSNFSSETNFQISGFRWNYGKAVNPDDPQTVVLDPAFETIAVLGNPGYVFDDHALGEQLQQKFKWYLDKHTVKLGLEVISTNHQLYGGGNANGNYTVLLTQDQIDQLIQSGVGSAMGVNDIPADAQVLDYNVELRPQEFGARQTVFSIYAEDQMALSEKLHFTAGLRYDYDNLSKGGADHGDMNNIAPRLSINYKLNERSSIRAGWGLFYDKINYAIYSDALQQNTTSADYKAELQALIDAGALPSNTNIDQIIFDGNLSATAPATYLNGPSADQLQEYRDHVFSGERRILNPNGYANPFNSQATIGYQYQIDETKSFYADLVFNHSYNLFRLADVNAPSAYYIDPENVVVRSQASADSSKTVPIYSDANGSYAIINGDTVTGVSRNVVMTEDEGESKYAALSLNFKKDKGADKYAYYLSYTLSQLRNNTEDINFKAMDANNFDNEWGPSINDRTHVINAVFSYYPCKNFVATFATLIQSGQPINHSPDALIYGTADLNGDGSSFGEAYVGNSDRSPGETRNNDRLPWSNNFDVSLQYNFHLKGNQKFVLSADVFNIFNTQNLSGYSNNATQSNQIQIGPKDSGVLVRKNAGAPRQFQFGLRYSF
jgi:outer membrane receptor protein involved in Fe transport